MTDLDPDATAAPNDSQSHLSARGDVGLAVSDLIFELEDDVPVNAEGQKIIVAALPSDPFDTVIYLTAQSGGSALVAVKLIGEETLTFLNVTIVPTPTPTA